MLGSFHSFLYRRCVLLHAVLACGLVACSAQHEPGDSGVNKASNIPLADEYSKVFTLPDLEPIFRCDIPEVARADLYVEGQEAMLTILKRHPERGLEAFINDAQRPLVFDIDASQEGRRLYNAQVGSQSFAKVTPYQQPLNEQGFIVHKPFGVGSIETRYSAGNRFLVLYAGRKAVTNVLTIGPCSEPSSAGSE